MKKRILLISTVGVLIVATIVVVAQSLSSINLFLSSYEEVPAVSSDGIAQFTAQIRANSIAWQFTYGQLEAPVTQAHIHFGQKGVNGGISVWLCGNVANTPAGVQPCPPQQGYITGIITPSRVVGPAGQGIAPGEYDEFIRALRAGKTYVNIHTEMFPGGELRRQIPGEDHSNHVNGGGTNGSVR